MDVIDESPLLQEVMDPNDGTSISRQPFSGPRWSDILSLAQFDDIISILFIQIFMLFELDIVLNNKMITMVARIPFLILNH